MKLSAKHVAENRERVIDAALKLFRERGFDGVSIADLMRDAGLTHGGFYNHFASKAELAAQACDRAFLGSADVLDNVGGAAAGTGRRLGLAGYVSRYLSRTWRDAPSAQCPMVAFSADAARNAEAVGDSFASGLRAYVEKLAGLFKDEETTSSEARRQALSLAATLTGALTLARSVRASDPVLSDEILSTLREELLAGLLDGTP